MGPEAEGAQQRSGIVSAKILLFLQTLPVLIAEIKKLPEFTILLAPLKEQCSSNGSDLSQTFESNNQSDSRDLRHLI